MKLLNALRLIFTLHCDESSRLISESLDRELSGVERTAVRLHQVGCWSCRRLGKQLHFIREAARMSGEDAPRTHQLSDAAKQRILDALEGE